MTELYPSDAAINDLSGTADPGQEVYYPPIGQSPYYTSFYRMLYRLLDVSRRAGDLRVYKDGDLTFGIRAGRFMDGAISRSFAAFPGQPLANGATNYIALTAGGAVTVSQTGFPGPATPHIPLATIVTSGGNYAHSDIVDYRGLSIVRPLQHEQSLVSRPIPLSGCRNEDGGILDAVGGVGKLRLQGIAWNGGSLKAVGQSAQNNTKTDTLVAEYVLPESYLAGQDVQLCLSAGCTVAGGTAVTAKIDAQAYKLDPAGLAGADLCATNEQTLPVGSPGSPSFVITPASLAPGDKLAFLVRTTVSEGGNTGSAAAYVAAVNVKLDLRA